MESNTKIFSCRQEIMKSCIVGLCLVVRSMIRPLQLLYSFMAMLAILDTESLKSYHTKSFYIQITFWLNIVDLERAQGSLHRGN